jgi:hypothetical protein
MKKAENTKKYKVIADGNANNPRFNNDADLKNIEVIGNNLTYTEARRLVFEKAKFEADLHNGDWQYSWETNSQNIYFHSDDRKGKRKVLVGSLWDESIQVGDWNYFLEEMQTLAV